MEDLLKFSLTPLKVFDQAGMMKQAAKSTHNTLVQELEKRLPNQDQKVPSMKDKVDTTIIVDVMANVRKIKSKDTNNFGEFCQNTLNYIGNTAKDTNRIDLVFDS